MALRHPGPTRGAATFRRALAVLLLAVLGAIALPTTASADEPVRYPLAVNADDEVAVADLCNVLLGELGSETRVTTAAVPGHIATAGADGALTLMIYNRLLGHEAGVVIERTGGAVVVSIDRERVGRHVDRLEGFLRTLMGGGEPVMELERVAGSRDGAPPVVLVHGLDSSPASVAGAAAALAGAGYDVYSFRYPNDGRVRASAEGLGAALRSLRATTGQRISLVTLSMGGVVARTYLELDPSYAGEVARFIACCPPFAGSPLARYHGLLEVGETVADLFDEGWRGFFVFDGLGQAGGDLTPGSTLLRKLAQAHRARGVSYSILAGDRGIVPAASVVAARSALASFRGSASPGETALADALDELLASVQTVAAPQGDGAVTVDSTRIRGVIDHKVLHLNHLQFLAGDGAEGDIAALDEVLARLPGPAALTSRAAPQPEVQATP